MDKRQKSTLRSQHIRIADQLILDEDFCAALRRDKIFTNGMLDLIKAEQTPKDKVYKMLELLEKRGPDAFDKFVWILKENYEWLAKDLEEQYNKRLVSSQHERETHYQRFTQYETQPKHVSQDLYKGVDPAEYGYGTNRAVSIPVQHRTIHQIIPTQESVSAGYSDKDSRQFFPMTGYTHVMAQPNQHTQQQQDRVTDTTNNLTIKVPTLDETESDQKGKKYKDACMSPIGIIESPRKAIHKISDPTELKTDKVETHETESYDQGLDEIQNQRATVTTSTYHDAGSQFTRTSEKGSEGFDTLCENTDTVDGQENVTVGLEENDDDFPTSEDYYNCVRRGSSQISHAEDDVFHPEFGMFDDENDVFGSEISYEHREAFQRQIRQMEAMRRIYDKLTSITSGNEDIEDNEDNEVTLEMIDCEIDQLISRLENSDDMKMIRKCFKIFHEKERKQPLNMCIERLLADKRELDKKLIDKQKAIDQMVSDLYEHQKDMRNLSKMKNRLTEQENELRDLKLSLDQSENDAESQLKQIEEKDSKIETLEAKVKELQRDQLRRTGAQPRRGASSPRKVYNTPGQSPRKQSTSYGEPRISLTQGPYGNSQQSPRNLRRVQTYRK